LLKEMLIRVLLIAALLGILFVSSSNAETPVEHGRYLVEALAACGNCHTPRGPSGPQSDKYLAGGENIKHQDFSAVSSNITPDPETGVGKWSNRELFEAIREGRRPDGSLIGPAMPSQSYRALADADVEAIISYLRTVPAVQNAVVEKSQYDIALPASWGVSVGFITTPPKDDKIAYGAYLAGPVARCMTCHTRHDNSEPTIGTGGTPFYGPWGISVAANITPAGIGDWTDAEIERAIRTGVARDGHKLFPPMPFSYYSYIATNDMEALIAFLRSLPMSESIVSR
jgi:mono/diheme cytochrome c family protein